MTPLQEQMILKIAHNEMNAAKGKQSYNTAKSKPSYMAIETNTWADEIIESAEDKIVFASLVKDGLARHSRIALCAGVCLTEAGFAAYLEIKESASITAG
ncbi:hypothetical protein SIL73_13110 [Acidithiobacillus thiooxidans]|uniref:hypothetical protein n=1 Tax=Acidithiobacillus thiooxidans TaxID=930 RepID=UPI0029C3A0E3|nr:hypothetical protein [Acidithiobacillus thiooxidans]MDX5935629.1 hypothetical protein [Acidithiobacillus thiooxidans]